MEFNMMAILQEYAILPVATVCVLLGYLLKNIWAAFPNRYIPLVLLPVALTGVLWINGWAITPENVMAGICSAALAVYMHQNAKRLGKHAGHPAPGEKTESDAG